MAIEVKETRMATATKTGRIEVRTSVETKVRLQEAARITGQDLSSFVLDAANAKARSVLLEDRIIRFSDRDLEQLEAALNSANEPDPVLVDLFRKYA